MIEVKINESWKEILSKEFESEYFKKIIDQIKAEKSAGKIIYPPGSLIFNAFNSTSFDDAKVVIIGQDPYHGPGEAMGLSFSVPKGVAIPPSLLNIFKELKREFDYPIPASGDLSKWARQGVLLLNASLTVLQKSPNSHKHIGWHQFTDKVISILSDKKEHLVFMLWGNFARSKKILINPEKHLILESPHPSPLAGGGFFGNGHFSKCNSYLAKFQISQIDWRLAE
jgi:uracil-DNA glycosylase